MSLLQTRGRTAHHSALSTFRPAVLAIARLLALPLVSALPLSTLKSSEDDDAPKDASDPNLWLYLGVAVALVLLGGVFAGLTIALMGQDETYLQVIATSGEGAERRHAAKVLRLLGRGKHWVLVTLLLSNVITNETLPIVLDRSLGGGWPAVVTSTVLIVIFGEVVPQSICVRFGLSIGAYMAPIVTGLMWFMGPVAWPTAKLLDYLLGEDHGTMYKKAGLKTLVTLHKTLGTGAGEQLMEDEVTIINSVLDLKEKPVGGIMTPMQDVFTMSADTVLDEKMMDTILSQGYSRIPIYSPLNGRDFIGMLLVKILITYDPEDCKRVRDFALATLPETAPHTSCLDIINFFQEGKSHMVLVSDYPGQDKGALGVVTLEDVIEELIGEEIIDESDVFVDVHKAIRRLAPAPKTRFPHGRSGTAVHDDYHYESEVDERTSLLHKDGGSKRPSLANGQQTTFLMRRKSSNASDATRGTLIANHEKIRSGAGDMREHLKHLGPSNAASKPRATKFASVKIKPGVGTIPENKPTTTGVVEEHPPPSTKPIIEDGHPAIDEAVVALRSDSRGASRGAAAVFAATNSPNIGPRRGSAGGLSAKEASQIAEENAVAPPTPLKEEVKVDDEPKKQKAPPQPQFPEKIVVGAGGNETNGKDRGRKEQSSTATAAAADNAAAVDGEESGDLVPEMSEGKAKKGGKKGKKGGAARSGSITESIVEGEGGMKKVVLETTSSSSEEGGGVSSESRTSPKSGPSNGGKQGGKKGDGKNGESGSGEGKEAEEGGPDAEAKKKANRKKRGKRRKPANNAGGAAGAGGSEAS